MIGSLQRGGAEGQLVHMAVELKRRGHDIIMIVFHKKGRSHAKTLIEAGIKIYAINFPPMRPLWKPKGKDRAIKGFQKTLRILKHFEPDVIHPHLLESDIWIGFAQLFGAPGKIVTSRLSLGIFKEGQQWKQWLQNWVNKRTEIIICNAQAVSDDSVQREKNFDEYKIRVVRNGIEWDDFAQAEPVPKSEIPFEKKGPVVMCTANYHTYKGHKDLLEAWAQVSPKFPDAHLICFGRDTGTLPDLLNQLRENNIEDTVTLHPPIENVPNWLRTADLFAFPSHEEGLPNAVLEALAADLPIISTRVGGVPEILEDHPYTALVEPKNPDQMAEKLEEFLSQHPIPPRDEELVAKLRHQWSLKKMIDDHEKIYQAIVDEE